MNVFRITILSIFLFFAIVTAGWADTVVLASGAGYKKMVNALASAYEVSPLS